MRLKILLLLFTFIFAANSILLAQEKNDRILATTIKFKTLENNEELCVGKVFEIQWEGVDASELVTIEYSTNGGANWITITTNASGLSYNWTVPNTPSENCIARVIAPLAQGGCIEKWATTNLNVDHYRNGDSIPEVRDPSIWMSLTTGAWCYYNNDPANGAIYGKLYNWYAVNDSRGLAPQGWHIPSDIEWKTLEMCLGMTQTQADNTGWRGTNEGGKLKEAGTSHWKSPNTGATNESGFTALPSGWRNDGNGSFYYLGDGTQFWTSSSYSPNNAWSRYLIYDQAKTFRDYTDKGHGFSVRCIRD